MEADREKLNKLPKFETKNKLICFECGSTWFESKSIMICEFLLDPLGRIASMAEKPKKMERLPSYFRCIKCGKLREDNRLRL